MKTITILAYLILLLVTSALIGCYTSGRTERTIYVSRDPEACKSIRIDCSQYNKVDGSFAPFSDETGCGCHGLTGN